MPPEHSDLPPAAVAGGPSSYEQDLVQQEVVREGQVNAAKDGIVADMIAKSMSERAANKEIALPATIEALVADGATHLQQQIADAAMAQAAQEEGITVEALKRATQRADGIVEEATAKIKRNFLSPREREQQMRDIYRQQYGTFNEVN